ncbi:hypothetical protein [Verrucomicrobium sp. BvORR106]|uniref:hypothetical protein n=1 Tax=Verrucomicrobium sp. BvORR106 TaxID=1403819 RepID=UPI00056E78FD|nr:hypothetical protein [Verrucomicrobium sp. BvORR106]
MKPSPLGLIFGVLCTIAPFAVSADDFAAQLTKVTTTRGETFHNCKVLNFTPDTVTLMHDGGVKKVKMDQVPAALQQRFQYNEDTATAFAEAEQVRQKEMRAQEVERARQEEIAAADALSRMPIPAYQDRSPTVAQLERQVLAAAGYSSLPYSGGSSYYVPNYSDYSSRYYAKRNNYRASSYYYSSLRRPVVIYYTAPSCFTNPYARSYGNVACRAQTGCRSASVQRVSRPRTSVQRWVSRPR